MRSEGAFGWFVAWLNIVGLIAAQAGINYSCAPFILPFLHLPVSPRNVFLVFGFTLLVHGLLNQYGVKLVAWLNDVSVTVHILGVLAIIAAVFFFAPLQPVSFLVSTSHPSPLHAPYIWLFLLGLLQAQWTYTGFDGSAHLAEGTRGDAKITPNMPPNIAAPTTAGTGSEVGRSSVITITATNRKTVIFSPYLIPDLAIVDPELTLEMPPKSRPGREWMLSLTISRRTSRRLFIPSVTLSLCVEQKSLWSTCLA